MNTPGSESRFSFIHIAENCGDFAEACGEWLKNNESGILYGLIGALMTISISLFFMLAVRKIFVPLVRKRHPNRAKELDSMSGPFTLTLLCAGFSLSSDFVHFPGKIDMYVDKTFYALFILATLSMVLHAVRCTSDLLMAKMQQKNPATYSMNKLLLDLSRSIVNLGVWCCAVFFILQDVFQLNVTHLLVSAGVMGLAVAFAAQNTIANVFGAFSILGCKLFKVGDWIKIGTTEGIVEKIGFRSVFLRAFDGRVIDIPNRLIADSQLENFSDRLFWREHFCFGLVYQTTPEQMQQALGIIEDIGRDLAYLMVPEKPVKFHFTLFNESSLDLDGYVWFRSSDWFTMRASRSRFNEEVLKRFNQAGLSIAYPSRSVYIERNAPKDVPQ